MNKIYISVLSLFLIFASVSVVLGEIATVTSLTVPTTLESGQIADITWTINGGGHSLIIFCAQGIKIRYASTNAVFPCDTKVSVSKYASDGISLFVANVSGNPRIITARVIPKDPNGATDYDAGAKESTIYVRPSRYPVGSFNTNATSTISGAVTTFYWSSSYLDGVNFKIACNDSITATSTLYGTGTMPCNRMIFANDLPGSGSVSFKFDNQSASELPLNVTLFPAMSPGVYDGTHSETITLTVASDAQKPLAARFNASRNKIYSGDSILFDWSVTNGNGMNIKFTCSPLLQINAFSQATTTTLNCGGYAWSANFAPTGSTSVTFINSNNADEIVTATMFPLLRNGNYDGNSAQTIRINVAPVPKTPLLPQAASSVAQIMTIVPTISTPASTVPSSNSLQRSSDAFKAQLKVGIRSEEVKLLQKFLAKDKSLYPERLVTGYFGALTKRAVGRFQIKFGLIKNSKDPAYGVLDAKTRFSLNALQ
ncbi:MAG: peptidoglycan-binding domain-containing protein [bacterium]|nr:peptidoglycan-binding domain-containing protein [bacterium]